jgi:hypothetical protein
VNLLLLGPKRQREIRSCREVWLPLGREHEFTLIVLLATARAGTKVLLSFESASSAKVAALVACYPHPLCLLACIICGRLSLCPMSSRSCFVVSLGIARWLERSSATFHALVGTLFTSFHSLPSITSVRARTTFLLASLTTLL